jgi:hypothetical protein
MIRVVVCGGREYSRAYVVRTTLDALHKDRGGIKTLVHGDSTGADELADRWAYARGVDRVKYPASWRIGPKAGPMRNAAMLDEVRPDCVVAFPGGNGTADCVAKAKDRGIEVVVVEET